MFKAIFEKRVRIFKSALNLALGYPKALFRYIVQLRFPNFFKIYFFRQSDV
jgi:hypothetical protein